MVDDGRPPLRPGKILRVLLKHKVRFVIVGGYGVLAHNVPDALPTADIDICPLIDEENLVRLRAALDELDVQPFIDPATEPTPAEEERLRQMLRDLSTDRERLLAQKSIMLVTEDGPLDLVIRPDGILDGYHSLAKEACFIEAIDPDGQALGFKVPVASLRHIYQSKKAAGRRKDQKGLPSIMRALRDRGEFAPPGALKTTSDEVDDPSLLYPGFTPIPPGFAQQSAVSCGTRNVDNTFCKNPRGSCPVHR